MLYKLHEVHGLTLLWTKTARMQLFENVSESTVCKESLREIPVRTALIASALSADFCSLD